MTLKSELTFIELPPGNLVPSTEIEPQIFTLVCIQFSVQNQHDE
jgi:hypothetical protein